MLATALRSDGHYWNKLYTDGGPSSTQSIGHVRMEGKEVFKHAVGMITDVVYKVLDDTGHTIDDLDWFVPHQANKRIIDGAGGEARAAAGKGGGDGGPARQYVRCVGAAGAEYRCRRWPDQARRPGDDRGDGRRLHLGRIAHPLVICCESRVFRCHCVVAIGPSL